MQGSLITFTVATSLIHTCLVDNWQFLFPFYRRVLTKDRMVKNSISSTVPVSGKAGLQISP